MTPLHAAAAAGHSSVVEVLIRSHADINAINAVSQCIATLQYIKTVHVQTATFIYSSVCNIMKL